MLPKSTELKVFKIQMQFNTGPEFGCFSVVLVTWPKLHPKLYLKLHPKYHLQCKQMSNFKTPFQNYLFLMHPTFQNWTIKRTALEFKVFGFPLCAFWIHFDAFRLTFLSKIYNVLNVYIVTRPLCLVESHMLDAAARRERSLFNSHTFCPNNSSC